MTRTFDALVAQVVTSGNCSGCGACAAIDPGMRMELSPDGFMRPRRVTGEAPAGAAERFRRTCPGALVTAQRPSGATYHPMLGPVMAVWEAAATDPEIRRRGSSGGVLTALNAWLVETGEVSRVIGAAGADGEPRRTVPVTITTRAEALEAAGSRYAPVSVCASPGATDASGATVGKPCEISALRALTSADGSTPPLLLSFFCAGTPSQHATDTLLEGLGVPRDRQVTEMWYRGRGWPGRFTARTTGGAGGAEGAGAAEVSASYDESWGSTLGPAVQWRCKICPDGVGESSDVTAGDFWRSDARGYPVFTETDGFSALIARTPRGLDVVRRAVDAGVLTVRTIDPDEVAAVQPLQRSRRRTLLGRMAGARAAGARTPRYRGFGLIPLALANGRESVRTARGTFRRVRARTAARTAARP